MRPTRKKGVTTATNTIFQGGICVIKSIYSDVCHTRNSYSQELTTARLSVGEGLSIGKMLSAKLITSEYINNFEYNCGCSAD